MRTATLVVVGTVMTVVLLGSVLLLSGASTNPEQPTGYLTVEQVDNPPENATVTPINDTSLAEGTLVYNLVQRSFSTNSEQSIDVNTSQYNSVQQNLNELPRYNGTAMTWGYYIRYKNETFRLRLYEYD